MPTILPRASALALAALLLGPPLACSATHAETTTVPPPPAAPATAPDGSPAPAPSAALVHVRILAINDFHGYLEPPAGSVGSVVASPSDPIAQGGADAGVKLIADGGAALVPAGGAAYLATHLRTRGAGSPGTFVVSAGDLTGASPLLSNLFDDEPTILAMNQMGLDIEAVGNHDFDRGLSALERRAHGDCDAGACSDGGAAFPGARFEYLAANVTLAATGRTIFAPYAIREVSGAKIAFIGATLEGTPQVTVAGAVQGLSFANEIATANALVPKLKGLGVSAIVLVVHNGGFQGPGGTYDSCEAFSGTPDALFEGERGAPVLDPAVEIVISGHTHQPYNCVVGGRLLTSAASYGRVLTQIDLTLDPSRHTIVDKRAKNVAVTRDVAPDPDVQAIIARYKAQAAPKMGRVIGYVKADFVGNAKIVGSPSCETPLGDLIADAQLAATRGRSKGNAEIAFMNPGGIRADLLAKRPDRPEHVVTYADAFEVQPFGNQLVTMTLTGRQIHTLLLEQFGRADRARVLQPSANFTYAYAYDPRTKGATIDPTSIRVSGKPLRLDETYRVTVNGFLADGGDGFTPLKLGTDRVLGVNDLDALTLHLSASSGPRTPLAPAPLTRVRGTACR